MGRPITNLSPAAARTRQRYGTEHKSLRRYLAPLVEQGSVTCWRCHRPIMPTGYPCPRCGRTKCRWDLGHDAQGTRRGAEHSCENRSTATIKAERRGSLPKGTVSQRKTPRKAAKRAKPPKRRLFVGFKPVPPITLADTFPAPVTPRQPTGTVRPLPSWLPRRPTSRDW